MTCTHWCFGKLKRFFLLDDPWSAQSIIFTSNVYRIWILQHLIILTFLLIISFAHSLLCNFINIVCISFMSSMTPSMCIIEKLLNAFVCLVFSTITSSICIFRASRSSVFSLKFVEANTIFSSKLSNADLQTMFLLKLPFLQNVNITALCTRWWCSYFTQNSLFDEYCILGNFPIFLAFISDYCQ